jgi:hypothetical protein
MGLAYRGAAVGAPPLTIEARSGSDKDHRLILFLAGISGGLALLALVIWSVFLLKRQQTKKADEKNHGQVLKGIAPPPFLGHNVSVNLLCRGESFSYAQLQQATRGFDASNFLKSGHSGDFFKGLLEGGVPIVLKRINLGKVKREGFLGELDLFSKASHTRLVPLLGHCFEREDEKLLVYKFMPARDLGFALHKKLPGDISEDALPSLDWITRLKIAIGAAEGLTYLHHDCTPPLVHR